MENRRDRERQKEFSTFFVRKCHFFPLASVLSSLSHLSSKALSSSSKIGSAWIKWKNTFIEENNSNSSTIVQGEIINQRTLT